jgi:hypothetical protein
LTSLPKVGNEDVFEELGIRVAAVLIKFVWSFLRFSIVIFIFIANLSASFWLISGLFLEIFQTDFRSKVGVNLSHVL